VNSETDFVAKDENFINFAESVAAAVAASGETDVAALASQDIGDGRSIEQARTDLVQKVGENISVRRASIVEADGPIAFYTHGARIGAIVALEGGDEELARDIAMHVAAINPVCVDESGVPADTLERERRIFTEQANDSGKQPFVKDPDITVGKLLKGADASVVSFIRFEVGEGIEKKEDNFVEEVMAQVQGNS
jgi:elongation factor Ts